MARIIGKSKNNAFEEPTVNLTPLIDVVFVILIGFIVIAPLLEIDKVELANAPHGGPHQGVSVQETSPVSIHVRQDNSILIKGALVSQEDLEDKLMIMKNQYPQAVPQLFHDKKAHFGTYQTVKNALESVGYEQLDIVLNP